MTTKNARCSRYFSLLNPSFPPFSHTFSEGTDGDGADPRRHDYSHFIKGSTDLRCFQNAFKL